MIICWSRRCWGLGWYVCVWHRIPDHVTMWIDKMGAVSSSVCLVCTWWHIEHKGCCCYSLNLNNHAIADKLPRLLHITFRYYLDYTAHTHTHTNPTIVCSIALCAGRECEYEVAVADVLVVVVDTVVVAVVAVVVVVDWWFVYSVAGAAIYRT